MYEFSRKVNCLTSKLLDFVGPKTRRVIKKKREKIIPRSAKFWSFSLQTGVGYTIRCNDIHNRN